MKYTVKEFNDNFPDEAACLKFIFKSRWPDGGKCKCGKKNCFHPVKKRRSFACAWCGHQIYPTAGTIFHKSSTPLKLWFYAMFLMSSSKNGVAALELHRQLGVSYKTAHRMGHKIRQLMVVGIPKMTGVCEADEAYIGGEFRKMHLSRRRKFQKWTDAKVPIVGVVERGGNVQVRVVENAKGYNVLPNIIKNVKRGSTICTDEANCYKTLRRLGYKHSVVHHQRYEWVRGDVTTNTIEGFWSQLKRSLSGTFHCVSNHHLQRYVDEFVYRYNRRFSETPVFLDLIPRSAEKRL